MFFQYSFGQCVEKQMKDGSYSLLLYCQQKILVTEIYVSKCYTCSTLGLLIYHNPMIEMPTRYILYTKILWLSIKDVKTSINIFIPNLRFINFFMKKYAENVYESLKTYYMIWMN